MPVSTQLVVITKQVNIAYPDISQPLCLCYFKTLLGMTIGGGYWIGVAASQIVFGLVVGVAVGFVGLKFVQVGHRRGWMSSQFEKISAIALAILAYALAEAVAGNGFIAAFCMGLTLGNLSHSEMAEEMHEHAEVEVALLMLLTFMIYGSVMLPLALEQVTVMMVVYALLSLTLVRMVPVAISLIGSKVRWATVGFLGWFGPRGVASILYIFVMLEAEGLLTQSAIYGAVMITVLLSVLAHGMTASPFAKWYGQRMVDEGIISPDAAEHQDVPLMPLRVKTEM